MDHTPDNEHRRLFINGLRAMRERLVCKQCRGKEIKLMMELGQSEGKKLDVKVSTSIIILVSCRF